MVFPPPVYLQEKKEKIQVIFWGLQTTIEGSRQNRKKSAKAKSKKCYLRRNDKGCPGHQDEETRGEIVDDQILGVMTTDVDVKASEGKITKLTVIVEEQSIFKSLKTLYF